MVEFSSVLCATVLCLIKSMASALGRAMEMKLSWGNATSLVGSPVRRMNSLPPSSTAASSCFPRPRAEHSWGQTKGIGQELHLAHGVEKDRGAAVVCSTNVEEYALIHHVPGQRSHANVFKLDREHDAGT